MGKALYVEATAVGYYGGKRVAGSKFWLADGKAEFSKKWMKEADPSQAVEMAPRPIDGGSESEQNKQIDELTKAAEVAEAERNACEDKIRALEKERDDLKAEAAKLKFDFETIKSEHDHLNAELQAADEQIKNMKADKNDNGKKS